MWRDFNDDTAASLAAFGVDRSKPVSLACECSAPDCSESIQVTIHEHARRVGTRSLYLHVEHASFPMRAVSANQRFVACDPGAASLIRPLVTALPRAVIDEALAATSRGGDGRV